MVHWYSRDPDAALAGMTELTLEERGAYNTLIDLGYARDGNIPDDDRFICRHLHCRPQTWHRLKISLETHGKLTVNRGQIEVKRVANELERARKRMAKHEVYNEKRNENNANPKTRSVHNDHTTTTTTTTTKKEYELANGVKIPLKTDTAKKSNGHVKDSSEDGPEFLKFWSVFPNKAKREVAKIALAKALKITTLETILSALAWQVPRWKDPDFYPHAATWLNQKRWNEERPYTPPEPKFLIPR